MTKPESMSLNKLLTFLKSMLNSVPLRIPYEGVFLLFEWPFLFFLLTTFGYFSKNPKEIAKEILNIH